MGAAAAPSSDRPWWARLLLATAWTGSIAALLWSLTRVGHGRLSTPPLFDGDRLSAWLADRDAVTVGFALLRLVALGLGWYLLVVTGLGLLARASRLPGLVRLADLATVPAVRRALGGMAGLGLSASAVTRSTGALIGPAQAPAGPRRPWAGGCRSPRC